MQSNTKGSFQTSEAVKNNHQTFQTFHTKLFTGKSGIYIDVIKKRGTNKLGCVFTQDEDLIDCFTPELVNCLLTLKFYPHYTRMVIIHDDLLLLQLTKF